MTAETEFDDVSSAMHPTATEHDLIAALEKRLGRLHARQRLGIEKDHEAQVFGQGLNFFHPENLTLSHALMRWILKASGTYWRGARNAGKVELRHHRVTSRNLPGAFDGFAILHISDLHADMSEPAMARVIELVRDIPYDAAVLTGDFRGQTFGPYDAALAGTARVVERLRGPVYGVLGNHDTVMMVPGLEAMGIRMLMNEGVSLERGASRIHLAGVDDAHFYRMDNIEKASRDVPQDEFSILITHTAEIYRQAAHAGFDLLLSGHTHGGQICLPGGVPITLDAALPRAMGAGGWRHHGMIGYTSVGAGCSIVPVRFNCPPEITLHHLRAAS